MDSYSPLLFKEAMVQKVDLSNYDINCIFKFMDPLNSLLTQDSESDNQAEDNTGGDLVLLAKQQSRDENFAILQQKLNVKAFIELFNAPGLYHFVQNQAYVNTTSVLNAILEGYVSQIDQQKTILAKEIKKYIKMNQKVGINPDDLR